MSTLPRVRNPGLVADKRASKLWVLEWYLGSFLPPLEAPANGLRKPNNCQKFEKIISTESYEEAISCEKVRLSVSIFSSVQSLSCVQLFATPWTAACWASLSITNSWSLPESWTQLMSIESVMPSNLILCHPLLLLSSIFPNIRVFSNESVLCIRWPKYWSFSFSISFHFRWHER